MNLKSIVFLAAFGVTLGTSIGCGGTDSEPVATTSAAIVQALEGTYDFDLDASDVASKHRARCESQSHGDATHAATCWNETLKEASVEKIRFTRNAAGQLVFSSYSIEAGKEELFVEVPLTVTTVDQGAFLAKPAGWPRGTLVGQLTHARAQIRIEQPSDGTIVVLDKEKGRLVYHRASA